MSFLDSVLSSLGTGKPSPVPTSRPEPPVSSSNTKPEPPKPGPGPVRENGNAGSGTKRKAEAQLQRRPKPVNQVPGRTPAPKQSTSSTRPKSRPTPARTSTAKPPPDTNTSDSQKPSVPAKAPPKGSYADLMAKAKDLQQKTPTSVGTLKHQTGPKERLNKTERRKRVMGARAKEKDALSGKKPSPNPKVGGAGKREPEEPSYKGTSRPTQPSQPTYRGTAGLPSRGGAKDRKLQSKRSKMDDYLGTDEEDEGDYAGDYDDYYSESSDMEAGLNDVEQEEAVALKSAQREDEEEWQAELAAKKEKLDRRNKLSSLASRAK